MQPRLSRRFLPPPDPLPAGSVPSTAVAVRHRLAETTEVTIGGGGRGGEREEEASDVALLALRLAVGRLGLRALPTPLPCEGPRDERRRWGLGSGHLEGGDGGENNKETKREERSDKVRFV